MSKLLSSEDGRDRIKHKTRIFLAKKKSHFDCLGHVLITAAPGWVLGPPGANPVTNTNNRAGTECEQKSRKAAEPSVAWVPLSVSTLAEAGPRRANPHQPQLALQNVSAVPKVPESRPRKEQLQGPFGKHQGAKKGREEAWDDIYAASKRPKSQRTEEDTTLMRGHRPRAGKFPAWGRTQGIGLGLPRPACVTITGDDPLWLSAFFFFLTVSLGPGSPGTEKCQSLQMQGNRRVSPELRCFPNEHLDGVNHPGGKHFRPAQAAGWRAAPSHPAGVHKPGAGPQS